MTLTSYSPCSAAGSALPRAMQLRELPKRSTGHWRWESQSTFIFSTAPLPYDIDITQLDALRAFKQNMQERGLLGEFSNPEQLNHEVWKAIEHDIATLELDARSAVRPPSTGVEFQVQPQQEREVSGANSKGVPRYSTKHWLDVTNVGDRDAEEVTFKGIFKDGFMHLHGPDQPTTIHKGQTRRLPVQYAAGGSDGAMLRICWTEDGNQNQREFHVG